jgi:ribonuclease Z
MFDKLRPLMVIVLALGLTPFLASEADAQVFRITLLGTGSPAPRPDRYGAATLVEAGSKILLFDAGRGASLRIWQLGIPLRELDAVFVTHFHHDHISGLADLWLTGWLPPPFGQRQQALKVLGPTGISDITQGLQDAYARDIDIRVADEGLPRAGATFDVTEFSGPGSIYDQDGVRVTAFPVNHGELIKPAFGYRVDFAGRSVLISGDTKFDENLIEAGRGVDVVIHEVVAASDELFERYPAFLAIKDHHTTPEEAGRVFDEIQPKLAVYTHLVRLSAGDMPELDLRDLVEMTRRTYNGPLVVGHDLLTIDVGDSVVVYDRR